MTELSQTHLSVVCGLEACFCHLNDGVTDLFDREPVEEDIGKGLAVGL